MKLECFISSQRLCTWTSVAYSPLSDRFEMICFTNSISSLFFRHIFTGLLSNMVVPCAPPGLDLADFEWSFQLFKAAERV